MAILKIKNKTFPKINFELTCSFTHEKKDIKNNQIYINDESSNKRFSLLDIEREMSIFHRVDLSETNKPNIFIFDQNGNKLNLYKLSRFYYDFENEQLVFDKNHSLYKFMIIFLRKELKENKYAMSLSMFDHQGSCVLNFKMFINNGFNSSVDSIIFIQKKEKNEFPSDSKVTIKPQDFIKRIVNVIR